MRFSRAEIIILQNAFLPDRRITPFLLIEFVFDKFPPEPTMRHKIEDKLLIQLIFAEDLSKGAQKL
jgi:hypothetical protein